MSYPQDEFSGSPGGGLFRHTGMLPGRTWSSTARTSAALSLGSGVMALDTGNAPDEFRAHPDWIDRRVRVWAHACAHQKVHDVRLPAR